MHREQPPGPIEILQTQVDDLAGTQPQSGEQEQNTVIALANDGALITALQEQLDLRGLEIFGHPCQAPIRHRRHDGRQIDSDLATLIEKTQEAAKRRDHQLSRLGRETVRLREYETGEVVRLQRRQFQGFITKADDEKTPNNRVVVSTVATARPRS